jgi:ankyrin repeat protein
LIFAANAGQQKMVEFLLSKGANPNAKDNQNSTPVMFAAQHGFDVIVRRLLTSGADVLARGTHGLTAVDLAVQNKHHETLQILQR